MNKVILMGRLTRDPEIRYAQDNSLPVARFTIAVDRRFKRDNSQQTADFISCVAFGKTAEFFEKSGRTDPDQFLHQAGWVQGIFNGCCCRECGICGKQKCIFQFRISGSSAAATGSTCTGSSAITDGGSRRRIHEYR